MNWTPKEKVKCEGYFDTVGGKQVPRPCSTEPFEKSADAARCRACHALYRKAAKLAPIDTPMGREYERQRIERGEALERRRMEKEKEIDERFTDHQPYHLIGYAPDPHPKDKTGRRHIIKDREGFEIAEMFFGIPPQPGKSARKERGHLAYTYHGFTFLDPDEDIKRRGTDWWFTTWTISPVADIGAAKLTGPTITRHTGKGRKLIIEKSRDVSQMTTKQYKAAMKRRDEGIIFQCFDCKNHVRRAAGGKVLDAFCERCSRIVDRRNDSIFMTKMKGSRSMFPYKTKIKESDWIGHPQEKDVRKSAKRGGFFAQVDRYFVKNKKFREIETWNWSDRLRGGKGYD